MHTSCVPYSGFRQSMHTSRVPHPESGPLTNTKNAPHLSCGRSRNMTNGSSCDIGRPLGSTHTRNDLKRDIALQTYTMNGDTCHQRSCQCVCSPYRPPFGRKLRTRVVPRGVAHRMRRDAPHMRPAPGGALGAERYRAGIVRVGLAVIRIVLPSRVRLVPKSASGF